MPTPFEELNERYKNQQGAFSRKYSTPTASAPPARNGIWDAIQREFNQIRKAPFGQMVEGGVGAVNRGLSRAWRGVGAGVEGYGKFFGSPMIQNVGRTTKDYWNKQAGGGDRQKRLDMAGVRLPASHGPGTKPKSLKSEVAPAGSAMKEPGKASTANKAAYPGVATPTTAPMKIAPADQRFAKSAEDNARARYLKMANMSLEDRNRMASEQGIIHTIRGTKQGWWKPGAAKEFDEFAQAVTGLEGKVTMKDELDREQKSLDRLAGLEQTRYKADKGVEGLVLAAKERNKAIVQAAKIRADAVLKAAKSGSGGGKVSMPFEFQETGEGKLVAFNKVNGTSYELFFDDASKAASVLSSLGLDAQSLAFGVSYFEALPQETRMSVLDRMDTERKALFLKVLEAERKKKKQ